MIKSIKKILPKALAFLILATPALAFAQSQSFLDLSNSITGIIGDAIPVLFGIAFIVFLWGAIRYIAASGSEDVSESKNLLIYGIIGLAVMTCIWGLVHLVTYTFLGQ